MNISEDLQKGIIGCILSKPYLVDDLGGVNELMFDDSYAALFMLVREQALTGSIDLHLLQAKSNDVSLPVPLSEIIGRTNTSNFNKYINEAINEYKKFSEIESAQELITDLMLPDSDVYSAIAKHEKVRADVDGQFINGLPDRMEDLKEAQSVFSSRVQPTGIKAIDSMIRGLMIGGFDLYPARPSMGKTTLMTDIALSLARQGIPVAIISLEMEKSLLYKIIACKISGVHISLTYISKDAVNEMNVTQRKEYDSDMIKYNVAFGDLSNIPLHIYDDTDCTSKIEGIIPFIRNVKKAHGIEFYFIDYIQKIKSTDKFNSRNYELEHISNSLSVLPKRIKVHISAFSQLSKAVESRGGTKRPNMADIRDSGAIEQDGFNIGMLYRPEYYDIKEDIDNNSTVGILEIIWVKGRVFGQIGSTQLMFDDATKSYKDLEDNTFANLEQIKEDIEIPMLQETNGKAYNGMIASSAKVDDDENIPF